MTGPEGRAGEFTGGPPAGSDDEIHFGYEPGWTGGFTRHETAGAHPNGTRIVKVQEEDGDTNPIGTRGTVLGSLDGSILDQRAPDGSLISHFYFVEWDTMPRAAVGVLDWKLDEVLNA